MMVEEWRVKILRWGREPLEAIWRQRIAWSVILLLLVHSAILAYGAWLHSPGWDELGHLPAGLAHWLYGDFRFYKVNPPLVRMVATLPLLLDPPKIDWESVVVIPNGRPEFSVSGQLFDQGFEQGCWYFTIARWVCLPFSLLGALVVFGWSKELFGTKSALIALTLWSFSPLVLTNAQMITPDLGATALAVTSQYLFRQWVREPAWERAFSCGIVLGLALLSKFTLVILPPLWCGLWFATRSWKHNSSFRALFAQLLRETLQLVVVFMIALYIINLFYTCDGSFTRLGDYTFMSRTLSGSSPEEAYTWGNRFSGTFWGQLPVPLPEQYVLGIDFQKRDFERGYPSYLRGQWKHGGWWYYYLYGLLVKEPIGFWLLFILAIGLAVPFCEFRVQWREELMLWTPAIVVLALVSSQTGFNHHLRYILPAMPFIFIGTSRVGTAFTWVSRSLGGFFLRLWVVTAIVWFALSSLRYSAHSHAYLNELAGGPAHGHDHLLDSNIDWGQDLLPLKRWLDKHPEVKLSGIAYSVPASYVQLEKIGPGFDRLPPGLPPGCAPEGAHIEPGWYVVFIREMREQNSPYWYFMRLTPESRIGWTAYVYHLTEDKIQEVMRSLTKAKL